MFQKKSNRNFFWTISKKFTCISWPKEGAILFCQLTDTIIEIHLEKSTQYVCLPLFNYICSFRPFWIARKSDEKIWKFEVLAQRHGIIAVLLNIFFSSGESGWNWNKVVKVARTGIKIQLPFSAFLIPPLASAFWIAS